MELISTILKKEDLLKYANKDIPLASLAGSSKHGDMINKIDNFIPKKYKKKLINDKEKISYALLMLFLQQITIDLMNSVKLGYTPERFKKICPYNLHSICLHGVKGTLYRGAQEEGIFDFFTDFTLIISDTLEYRFKKNNGKLKLPNNRLLDPVKFKEVRMTYLTYFREEKTKSHELVDILSNAINEYDRKKGRFRKFFRTRSGDMSFLSNFKKNLLSTDAYPKKNIELNENNKISIKTDTRFRVKQRIANIIFVSFSSTLDKDLDTSSCTYKSLIRLVTALSNFYLRLEFSEESFGYHMTNEKSEVLIDAIRRKGIEKINPYFKKGRSDLFFKQVIKLSKTSAGYSPKFIRSYNEKIMMLPNEERNKIHSRIPPKEQPMIEPEKDEINDIVHLLSK